MDCYPSYAPPGPRHDIHIINQSGMFMGYPRQRLSSMPDAAYRSDGLHLASGHRTSHDSKPRLSKEQQDILENAFRQQAKPSTNTKKQYAQSLGVPLDKVNVSFPDHLPLIISISNITARIGSKTVAPRSSRKRRSSKPPTQSPIQPTPPWIRINPLSKQLSFNLPMT